MSNERFGLSGTTQTRTRGCKAEEKRRESSRFRFAFHPSYIFPCYSFRSAEQDLLTRNNRAFNAFLYYNTLYSFVGDIVFDGFHKYDHSLL